MEATLDERFVVYVREDSPSRVRLPVERELVTCATYEEARWVQRECTRVNRPCIIRYVGPSGGGD